MFKNMDRVCYCCRKTKPISEFKPVKTDYTKECKTCLNRKKELRDTNIHNELKKNKEERYANAAKKFKLEWGSIYQQGNSYVYRYSYEGKKIREVFKFEDFDNSEKHLQGQRDERK